MAGPSVTYTFSNDTTADASQVNQNFTDVINGLTDGTKDLTINAITCAGTATFNGNVVLGNGSVDDITFTGSLASSIPIKTTNSFDIGSSTLGLRALYFGANSQTVNIKGSSSMSATWTMTLPTTAGSANQVLKTDGAGVTSWGVGGGDRLLLTSDSYVATLVAGENLTAGNAACMDLSSGVFKVFHADSATPTRIYNRFGIIVSSVSSTASVSVVYRGPITGLSSLTVGAIYYVGASGALTTTPAYGNPAAIGQAIASDTLWVDPDILNHPFTTSEIMVRSHGGSAGNTAASFQADSEHFNFTSWSAGTTDSSSLARPQHGDAPYSGSLRVIDGFNTSGAVTAFHRSYNKTSWSAGTTRTTARVQGGIGVLSNVFYVGKGSTNTSNTGGVATVDSFNGSSWTAGAASLAAASTWPSCMVQGGKVRWVNGNSTAGADQDIHHTYNGSSASTDTLVNNQSIGFGGSSATGSQGQVLTGNSSTYTASRLWNGSAWGSNIATSYTYMVGGQTGPVHVYSTSTANAYINGGTSASTTSINNTSTFNGSTWSAGTVSSNARCAAAGGVL